MDELLRGAREAYARRDWSAAAEGLLAVREARGLGTDDLYVLGDALWWLGRVEESVDASEEAYRRYLHGDQPVEAAMAALAVAVNLLLRGDEVLGSGWLHRAQRLLEDRTDTVQHAYLVYLTEVEAALEGIAAVEGVDGDVVAERARLVQRLGQEHGDPTLVIAGLLGEGRALIKSGRVEGLAILDEVVVALVSEDLAPDWAGNIWCHLMAACHEVADVRRAAAWTEATARWLASISAAVLFTGICRLHRSQVLQLGGAWDAAEAEARSVCEELEGIAVGTCAEGWYQLGELRRLRGDLVEAEEAFAEAHRRGRDPQPGLALLRVCQGRADDAVASLRAAIVATAERPLDRFRLHVGAVEVAVATGDAQAAAGSAEELRTLASAYGTSGIVASARAAEGAAALVRGDAEAALPALRDACRRWRDLGAPYEAARTCVLLAEAYRVLGADDASVRELEAARAAFEQLGAAVDLARLGEGAPPGALTDRERQVLRLVAQGDTNRAVATALSISEKTVARHLSNAFTKLGASSRTEAVAKALERGLLEPDGAAR